ncbi:N-acetylmuramoyl-L-alanine amidase [Streptomyces daliensis]
MSNGSLFPPPRRPWWLPRALVVGLVLAVLLAACTAGWLVWQSMTRDDATAHARAKKTDGEDKGSDKAPEQGDQGKQVPEARPLKGKTVVIDPGHNPNNRDHPDEIARLVDIGTGKKECDTTGTATNDGYAEAEFTLDLAHRVRSDLGKRGATVVFTHDGDREYGPCVDERARTGNEKKADAVVSLHADGAPTGNRGFHVILPAQVRDGEADTSAIVEPSERLGRALVDAFRGATGERPADYIDDGKGLDTRGDLGGLNLSTVPKVFLECGNMRDAEDAGLLTDPKWRGRAAQGVADGIAAYLTGKR